MVEVVKVRWVGRIGCARRSAENSMNKQVYLTCGILFALGCFGIKNIFASGAFNFDVTSLFAPLALLLLLGIPGSRIIANFVFGLTYLVLAMALAAPMLGGGAVAFGGGSVPFTSDVYFVVVVFVLFYLAILLLLHWSLFLRPFEDHLGS